MGCLRHPGTCDCGGVSVRGPTRTRGDRDLCLGHQRTGLDTVRVLAPTKVTGDPLPVCNTVALTGGPHSVDTQEQGL